MKKYSLLIFSLAVNFAVFFLLVFLEYQTEGKTSWYRWGGDTREYLCYGESILQGEYRCGNEYLNRMPGLPILYAFFRLFTDQAGAMLLIVLLQVFLSSIAMYYLSLITKNNLGVKIDARLLILFFSTLFVYKAYDTVVLTESLAVSMMIIGIYFSFKADRKYHHYIITGIALTWCVFLRPYAVIILGLVVLYSIYKDYRIQHSFKKAILTTTLLLLPFILIEGAWVIRNIKTTGKFIPLQDNRYAGLNESSTFEESSYVKLWSWMLTIGEDAVYWNPGSMGSWMYGGDFKPDTFIYQPHMLSNSYGVKEIEQVRELYRVQKNSIHQSVQDSVEKLIVSQLESMINSYKEEKSFQYHFIAPVRIVKKTFAHSGPVMPVPAWPAIKKKPIHLVVKIYASLSYLIVLLMGVAGIIIWWRKNSETALLAAIALGVMGVLALFLRYTEFRLYIIVFPLLAVFTAMLTDYLAGFIVKKVRKPPVASLH